MQRILLLMEDSVTPAVDINIDSTFTPPPEAINSSVGFYCYKIQRILPSDLKTKESITTEFISIRISQFTQFVQHSSCDGQTHKKCVETLTFLFQSNY